MGEKELNIEASEQPQILGYAQSANTLFNFMELSDYLKQTLTRKAFIPRYYVENVEFLNLDFEGDRFDEVEVLQTCFCDIPLSKLFKEESVKCVGEVFEKLSPKDKEKALSKNTHPDFYGRYAIALSKDWGSKKGLQPIHYINDGSQISKSIKKAFSDLLSLESLPNEVVDDFLNRFAYMKPVRGEMEKYFVDENSVKRTLVYEKVFHDEQEWRYVPDRDIMDSYGIEYLHANPQAIEERETWNEKIRTDYYKGLWLDFEYSDIRYLIVPDNEGRNELIHVISNLPAALFGVEEDLEKKILISKIIVLENLKEDM